MRFNIWGMEVEPEIAKGNCGKMEIGGFDSMLEGDMGDYI